MLKKRLEVTAQRADGSEFPAELAIGVDDSPAGKTFIGYLRDITERTEAEQRRRWLEAQLLQAMKMEALGQGTAFRVLLPASAGAAKPRMSRRRSDRSGTPRREGRVLVVDDEHSVGEFMCERLSSWGLEADFVSTPELALSRVRESPTHYHLVITDHSMPSMTGVQLAQALESIAPHLPVLLYTGLSDRIREPSLPANMLRTVLRKPIDHARLSRIVGDVLGEQGVGGEAA